LTGSSPKPPSRTSAAPHRSPPAADTPTDTGSIAAVTVEPTNALYVVVLGRLRYDPRTRAYAERRTHEGLSRPEIIRCLKRYVAREIFNALPTLIAENHSTHPLAKP